MDHFETDIVVDINSYIPRRYRNVSMSLGYHRNIEFELGKDVTHMLYRGALDSTPEYLQSCDFPIGSRNLLVICLCLCTMLCYVIEQSTNVRVDRCPLPARNTTWKYLCLVFRLYRWLVDLSLFTTGRSHFGKITGLVPGYWNKTRFFGSFDHSTSSYSVFHNYLPVTITDDGQDLFLTFLYLQAAHVAGSCLVEHS